MIMESKRNGINNITDFHFQSIFPPKCLMMLIVFEAYEDQTSPACGTHFSLRCVRIQYSLRGKGKTSLLSNKNWETLNVERGRRLYFKGTLT